MAIEKVAAVIAAFAFATPVAAQSVPTAPFNTPMKVGGWMLTPGNLDCKIEAEGPALLYGKMGTAIMTIDPQSDGRYELVIWVPYAQVPPQFRGEFALTVGDASMQLKGDSGYLNDIPGGIFTATLDSARLPLFDAPQRAEIRMMKDESHLLQVITIGIPALSAALRALPLCRPAVNLKASPRFPPSELLRPGDLDAVRGASKAGLFEAELAFDTTGHVQLCTIKRSSGKKPVDAKLCELLTKRALFFPATDAGGNPLAGAYRYRGDPKSALSLSRTYAPLDDD